MRIVAWNANGLLQHREELQVFLDLNKVDICLISETHFTKESYLKIRGYCVYFANHPQNTARGGSAVIIKSNILHDVGFKIETEKIQLMSVNIKTKQYELAVAAIYCPPKHNINNVEYLSMLRKLGEKFILGGDFNAKHTQWGSRLITNKGRELLAAITENGSVAHSTGCPTYWPTDPNKIPDLIDFFITRKISANFMTIDEEADLCSDHSAISLTLSEDIIKKENKPYLVNKHTNWEGFQDALSKSINLKVPLRTREQLEVEAEKFVCDIQQACWRNTPQIKCLMKGNNYPREIKELIAQKRRARRRWKENRTPANKNMLNNITQKVKREIQKIKNETLETFLTELTADSATDYSLWKATKNFKRPVLQNQPIRMENGAWARNNKQKAETFANYLENVFKSNSMHDEEETVFEGDNEELEIELVSPKEVVNEINRNINAKKAPGFDLITGLVLKKLPRKGIIKLTNLINASLRLKYIPRQWKIAEVIMIPKVGKPPAQVSSYRPISLLPVISKLFEKLYMKRLKSIIEQKKLIPDHQFGFREKHSTIEQVHRLTNIIETTLEERKVCATIFLDVAQAFDKVWHHGLLQKLQRILPKQHCQLIESFISERMFWVRQEDEYSELRHIEAGVPQGSVLGPILYLLFTYDIPETTGTTVATFADDTAILAVGKTDLEATERLQEAVNSVSRWTKKWKIKLNEEKSVHINFTNKKIKQRIPIVINGSIVPYENTAKYLGMTLDAKLRWKAHVKKKCEELKIKYRKMYWMLGRRSKLTVHNKLLLYKQILKPVWTYGIQLWGCARPSNISRIQRFQNKVLRGIVNAPWYARNKDIHRDLNIETVEAEIKRFAQKHEARLHDHVNVEAIQLLDSGGQVRRLKRRKTQDLV